MDPALGFSIRDPLHAVPPTFVTQTLVDTRPLHVKYDFLESAKLRTGSVQNLNCKVM